ncbi:MAG TPA: hypothetical protein VH969_02410 [Actinophytocola sp.]|uniref:hypothetical protein n=1 Tax=Actinophytocola sp. TaxID=1872138 RepID=UPI002F93A132
MIVPVLVSVADDRLGDLSVVVDGLRDAGLRVGEVLAAAGVVTGTVDSDRISTLSTVPGVADVEPQQSFGLAPPDSPVQ